VKTHFTTQKYCFYYYIAYNFIFKLIIPYGGGPICVSINAHIMIIEDLMSGFFKIRSYNYVLCFFFQELYTEREIMFGF